MQLVTSSYKSKGQRGVAIAEISLIIGFLLLSTIATVLTLQQLYRLTWSTQMMATAASYTSDSSADVRTSLLQQMLSRYINLNQQNRRASSMLFQNMSIEESQNSSNSIRTLQANLQAKTSSLWSGNPEDSAFRLNVPVLTANEGFNEGNSLDIPTNSNGVTCSGVLGTSMRCASNSVDCCYVCNKGLCTPSSSGVLK